MVMQGSTGYFDPDGNVILDSPYHIQVGEIYQKMYRSKLTTNITGTVQQWAAYKNGQLATIPYPNWQDFEFVAYTPSLAYKWQVVPLPPGHLQQQTNRDLRRLRHRPAGGPTAGPAETCHPGRALPQVEQGCLGSAYPGLLRGVRVQPLRPWRQ